MMNKEEAPATYTPRSGAIIATITHAAKLTTTKLGFSLKVFHLVFIPFSILVLLHSLLASPLLEKVEDAYEVSSLDTEVAWALSSRESVFLLSFSAVSFLGMMLIVLGSDLVCAGLEEEIRICELLVRVRSAWKVPLLAWLSVSALTVTFVIATVLTVHLVSELNIWWSCLVMVSVAGSYLSFASIATLALVVSVLENGIGDLKAVMTRSLKLMQGRWRDGFGLMLVLETLSVPIYVVFSVTTTDDDDALGPLARLGFGYAATLLFCMTKLFSFAVFTVFYHECRKHRGEELVTELAHGCSGYKAVPIDVNVVIVSDLDSSAP